VTTIWQHWQQAPQQRTMEAGFVSEPKP